MAALAPPVSVPVALAADGEAASADRAAVVDVIDRWYLALRHRDGREMTRILGPMAILQHDLWRCADPFSRACDLVFVPDLLASGSLRFSHEIREIEVGGALARANVLVRAWFDSQLGEYQRAAIDDFYLRRWPDGRWLIAVAGERTTAVP